MKKKFLFLIILIFTKSISAQNLKIIYDLEIYPVDIESDLFKDADLRTINHFKESNRYNKILSEKLDIIIISDGKNFSMSFSDVLPTKGMGVEHIKIARGSFFTGDVSFGNKEQLLIFNDDYKNYLIKETENDILTWQVTTESKEIAGYTCYKAIPKFKDESLKAPKIYKFEYVWFAPEINFVATPSFFGTNLPGAVLGYKNQLSEAQAKVIVSTDEEVNILETKNKKIFSYLEFNNFVAENFKKLMGIN